MKICSICSLFNKIIIIGVCFGLISCIKVVSLSDQLDTNSKLTVDAWINGAMDCTDCEAAKDQNRACFVTLTKSLGYETEVGLTEISQQQISDAQVVLSNGTQTETLIAQKVPYNRLLNDIPITLYDKYFYISKNIKGEAGKTYTLTIKWNGNTYEAVTTIPAEASVKKFMGVSYKLRQKTKTDSTVNLFMHTIDPKEYINYNRLLTSLNEQIRDTINPFYIGRIVNAFAAPDRLDNGVEVKERPIRLGRNRDNFLCGSGTGESNSFFNFKLPSYCRDTARIGDTIYFRLADIDKSSYEYINTLEFGVNAVSNPFSNPIKVQNNVKCISNKNIDALGGFIGGLLQTKKIIIK